ncbi:uncharacterized protein LOC126850775 isoform X2 [Cataglyphis hispanica]|uniref:uncharacterized protein LOC126850775 isoform X2 n=1 Tax=Cataglyphis hispanica TaxID=1086592 RepID=UPI00217F38D9|nr:uncharacterized protein LOC126850775 isoform X2 [Cataglyphis hispanica]
MTTKKEMFLPIKLPSHKSYQGKNLTGTERFVYDLAADINANIQQWNSFHIEGITYLKNIIQDGIIRNLEQIKNQLKVTTVLQETTNKLFLTWPMSKFDEIAETIYEMYHKEATLRRNLLENIAHNYTETWKMFYLAAWVHQPLLSENSTSLLNSLLIETGHQ